MQARSQCNQSQSPFEARDHPDILNGICLFQTICDPDLDIGVTVNKKTREPKNDVRLQPGPSSEPTLTSPDLRAVTTNGSEWVSIINFSLNDHSISL